MSYFSSFNISGSGLTAEKLRLDLISGNLANMNTTRTPEGGPYQRRTAVFSEKLDEARSPTMPSPLTRGASSEESSKGVEVSAIHRDPNPPRREHDPQHPDADDDGYVYYPNVEVTKEITDMITAQRAYESNSTAVNTAKDMYLKALEIGG